MGGQRSIHYPGLYALLSEPASDSKSFFFCSWSGVFVAIFDKTSGLPAIQENTCLVIDSINFGKDELLHVVLGKHTVLKQSTPSSIYIKDLVTVFLDMFSYCAAPSLRRPSLFNSIPIPSTSYH